MQWAEPITWAEVWRDNSYAVPAGGAFGTDATDFFCGAVEAGSNLVLRIAESPTTALAVLAGFLALVVYVLTRTPWRPTAPLRVARRRSWGQTLTASWRMYTSRPLLFLGIGLLAVPISLIIAGIQCGALQRRLDPRDRPVRGGRRLPRRPGVAIGTVLTLLTLAFVQAASTRAIVEIDAGRDVGPTRAYRMSLDSVRPLIGALAIAVTVVTLLTLSLFLVPIAVWLAVRWALIVPAAELEQRSAIGALRRSGELVRRQWLKVGTIVVVASVLAIVAGPLLGALLILFFDAPFEVVNIVAAFVYAVAMPFVGVATAYVYFDTLARERLEEASPAAVELPAEIQL